MSDWNTAIIEEFRANGGKVGGPFEGGDLLLLTTRGARTGAAHTTPVAYVRDDDRLVVIASAAGAPRNPAWFHNLRANPDVTVEVGTSKFQATASEAPPTERDTLWNRMVEAMPGFADYQKQTDRLIPVVILTRA
jgi:deazaflavin-dependent oxidoreductase (nitroreductase family)